MDYAVLLQLLRQVAHGSALALKSPDRELGANLVETNCGAQVLCQREHQQCMQLVGRLRSLRIVHRDLRSEAVVGLFAIPASSRREVLAEASHTSAGVTPSALLVIKLPGGHRWDLQVLLSHASGVLRRLLDVPPPPPQRAST